MAETELRRALQLGAKYLIRHNRATGRFIYKHGDPKGRRYNVLRHAGTIYALASYRSAPSPELDEVLRRSSRYLLERYVRDVPGERPMKAAFSLAQETRRKYDETKLGGTALAVVALCQVQARLEEIAPKSTLQAMGNFIVFMQRDDGSFHSKYRPEHGYNKRFRSLYYPGEAILALTMLYELDGDRRWLRAATRAVAQLVRSRGNNLIVDHWLMIGSQRLLMAYGADLEDIIAREAITEHMSAIARLLMATQEEVAGNRELAGAITKDGRPTPTATRIEGMFAAWQMWPVDDRVGRAQLALAIEQGVAFLVSCQLEGEPDSEGGIPRGCASERYDKDPRKAEIRIDYVQHFMSAVMGALATR